MNKEDFNMNFYEYLRYCRDKSVRGVMVITDKQYVFYVQKDLNDKRYHHELYIDIENTIHPNNQKEGMKAIRDNNVYVASLGHEIAIYMPENRLFSLAQYKFLEKVLDTIDKYNKEYNDNILIYAAYPKLLEQRLKTKDVNEAREYLFNSITKDIIFDDEVIIGDVLSNIEKIECIKYHINLEECSIIMYLDISNKRLKKYYEDPFYKDIVISIMPNLDEVLKEYSMIRKSLDDDTEVTNINYNNIKKIVESINNRKK